MKFDQLYLKNNFKQLIIRRSLAVICSLFVFCTVTAQDFEVAPVILNFDEDPGGIQTKKLTIRNHAAIKQAYEFQLGDYELDETGKKIRMPVGESKHSLADMITVNPSLIELNPNEETTIDVIITVPRTITGSRWGMLFVQAAKEQSANAADKTLATGVVLKPRIVVLLNQNPRSGSNYRATIGELKEITEAGKVPRQFSAVVSNLGNSPIDAKVYLVLANIVTAEEEKFEAIRGRVFPDGKREFILTLPKTVKPGKYALGAILDYGHRSALEGTQLMIEVQ